MPKIFERMGFQKPKMSAFDLSREQKLTCNMGELIPTYLEEVVPGDEFDVKTELAAKLQPLIAPMMHQCDIDMHYFFVPHRLTAWQNQKTWEDMIGGGQQGTSTATLPSFPYVAPIRGSRLADYLGLPTATVDDNNVLLSQLPFRAYQLIWNEYYRDETLNTPIDIYQGNYSDLSTLRKRSWEKDYFTSALPWTQRGVAQSVQASANYSNESTVQPTAALDSGDLGYDVTTRQLLDPVNGALKRIENISSITMLINSLRTASAIQKFLERQAVGGYRYIETILSNFGVKVPDERLQRPEYLGGGRQPLIVTELLSTAETGTDIVGTQTGQAGSIGTINQMRYKVPEHGYIMGIVSVMPKTGYFQGIPKHFTKLSKFQFYWPLLANLGEQPVLNQEIYYNPGSALNGSTFGYQQIWAEYKYGVSSVHGLFRSTLDFWHMDRKFTSLPTLNAQFVQADPTTRVYAVNGENVMIQLYHRVYARRPMPYFANPRID